MNFPSRPYEAGASLFAIQSPRNGNAKEVSIGDGSNDSVTGRMAKNFKTIRELLERAIEICDLNEVASLNRETAAGKSPS